MKEALSQQTQNRRAKLIFIFLLVLLSTLILRLYYIQIYMHSEITKMADDTHYRKVIIYPKRGMILDRTGSILAMSIETYSVGLLKNKFTGYDRLGKLADILECNKNELKNKIDSKKSFLYIAKKISRSKARKLRQWIKDYDILGLQIEEDEIRFYPNDTEGKQLLGSVRKDNIGNEGLEKIYEAVLKGKPKSFLVERKRMMQPVKLDQDVNIKNSSSIMLTIDKNIQHFADVALQKACEKTQAKGAMCIVMNPITCEILAMVMKPDYDSVALEKTNMPDAEDILDTRRIKAVTDYYEPGSTFKIILFSTAFNEGLIFPFTGEQFYCEQGKYGVSNKIIHDWKSFGWLTTEEVLINSSNIGCTKISERLSNETFYKYIKNFGFGEKTELNFPGESGGFLVDLAYWTRLRKSQIAFGQGIGVTALQMITAVSAVANGGNLRKPTIVKAYLDEDGKIEDQFSPTIIRRVMSEKTSEMLTKLMTTVVQDGTGRGAKVEGYNIAGKTGTAQKAINGVYPPNKYIISFIGFAPVEQPKFIIYVVIDEPIGIKMSGGKDVAPVFREIALRLFSYYHIPPSFETPDEI
jgi:cell division protein FtsI (penicillin-binding protein 3)